MADLEAMRERIDDARFSRRGSAPLRVLAIDHVGTLSRIRERYVRLLRVADIELTVLVPSVWVENYTRFEFQPRDDEEYTVLTGRITWPGKEIKALYYTGLLRAFRQARPDVILMMEESFALFALQTVAARALLAPRAPIIFYGNYILPYADLGFRPTWLFRPLSRLLLRRMALGLCVNQRAVDALRDFGYQPARWLFYGVDEEIFFPVPKDQARRAVGLPEGGMIFTYVGRLLEEKGVQDLIEAFDAIVRQRPGQSLRLIILGSGEYGDTLRARAAATPSSESITFVPSVPIEEVPIYINAASVLVLPSRAEWNEQFGRVIAEAMLCDTTVIGSTSGEIPRGVGDAGFIFEANDVDALRSTMERTLDDPEEVTRRRALGRAKAASEYTLGAFVDRLVDVLEEVSGKDARRRERS